MTNTTTAIIVPQIHTPNVWKGKTAYMEKRGIKTPLRSGPPPLTLISGETRLENITCSTDHIGTSIVATFNSQFIGTFDPIYLTANASALGFPWYGDYYASSAGVVYCSRTDVQWSGGNGTTNAPGVFRYVANFSPIQPDRLDLSPLERPAIVTGGGIELTEVRKVDTIGNPMVNSAGDYFENLPDFYIPGSEIQIAWNVSSNPLTIAQTYSFSTNSTAIWGQDAYAGVISKIACEQTFETYAGVQIQYWRMTVPMRFRNDGRGWSFQPLDYGYRFLSGSTVQNFVDPTTGVFAPVFLDGSGGLLNGDGTTNGASDAVVFPAASGSTPAGYQTLNAVDWSGLSCPVNPFS